MAATAALPTGNLLLLGLCHIDRNILVKLIDQHIAPPPMMIRALPTGPAIFSTHLGTRPPRPMQPSGRTIVRSDFEADQKAMAANLQMRYPIQCKAISTPIEDISQYFDGWDIVNQGYTFLVNVLGLIARSNASVEPFPPVNRQLTHPNTHLVANFPLTQAPTRQQVGVSNFSGPFSSSSMQIQGPWHGPQPVVQGSGWGFGRRNPVKRFSNDARILEQRDSQVQNPGPNAYNGIIPPSPPGRTFEKPRPTHGTSATRSFTNPWEAPDSTQTEPTSVQKTDLYVGSLHRDTDPEALKEFFRPYNPLSIGPFKATGDNRFGFVFLT